MKKRIDLEWLKGKSEAEQRQIMSNDDTPYGWMGGPTIVDAKEAEALRNGKPYRLTTYDLERLEKALWMGCDGDPDRDAFIIKMIAKFYFMENPKYLHEKNENAVRIQELTREYGPGNYSIGVGINHARWLLNMEGRAFARQVLS